MGAGGYGSPDAHVHWGGWWEQRRKEARRLGPTLTPSPAVTSGCDPEPHVDTGPREVIGWGGAHGVIEAIRCGGAE